MQVEYAKIAVVDQYLAIRLVTGGVLSIIDSSL